jgi:hypothetical protein
VFDFESIYEKKELRAFCSHSNTCDYQCTISSNIEIDSFVPN